MIDAQQKAHLLKLVRTRMPFGKYKGRLLVDLPDHYLTWFKQKGFPEGKLGLMIEEIFEMKSNGLEPLIQEMKKQLL